MRSAVTNHVGLFEQQLHDITRLIEPKLDELLPQDGRLAEAMRYAVLGNAKRFRPFLVLESAELFGVSKTSALNAAAAIECLHCYSLVHDDLPAMDDDDMRRGKPTVHKVFGEATAILAGDALLTLAFEILANPGTHPDANIRAVLSLGLARAAGHAGMAGGQQLDMETAIDVEKISALKTGELIRFSVLCGAILGNASADEKLALARYGEQLGLAFQVSDDVLDAGKDAAIGKRTFVTTLGIIGARERLDSAVRGAIHALECFGERAEALNEAAEFMRQRVE